ncbi:MAG: sugar ABC transporter permease [Eubacteriales bacterium]
MKRKYNRAAYFFLIPWFVGFVIFTLFPFVYTAYLSFTQVDSTARGYEITFIGLDNYITAFFKNTEFLPALLSFIAMIVPYTFVITVISFIIAILLEQVGKGKEILRMIYFLPVIIMSGPVMYQILDSSSNNLPEGVTIDTYLADSFVLQMIQSYSPALARFISDISSELTVILWFTGIPIVLFISGLKKINPSIYEAARIDAASPWQILFKITIPILKPMMLVAVIFTISQLGLYDGNPVYTLLGTAMANTSSGLGYAATYAWIYSFVVLIVIQIAFLLLRDNSGKGG